MRRAYEIKLNNGKNEITLGLRINLKAQFELKKKYKEDAIASILSAVSDAEKMAYIFTLALSFDGNENPITDGVELYDLLVDNGYAGQEQFMELLTSIAFFSGLMSEKRKAQIDAYIKGTVDEAFEEEFGEDEKNMTQPSEK